MVQAIPKKVAFQEADLGDDPIPQSDVLEGHPVARTFMLHADPATRYECGIWHCTPGTFRWTFALDEFVYVVAGDARIEYEDGRTIRVTKGEAAHFPRGRCVWTISKTVRKVFVIRS